MVVLQISHHFSIACQKFELLGFDAMMSAETVAARQCRRVFCLATSEPTATDASLSTPGRWLIRLQQAVLWRLDEFLPEYTLTCSAKQILQFYSTISRLSQYRHLPDTKAIKV